MNENKVTAAYRPTPWNKGKLIGQKPPLKLREIWALRTRLEMAGKTKELALFNLAIDSKLRGCDLVQLRVNDVARGGEVLTRASVIQQKTQEPVRFELTDPTRSLTPTKKKPRSSPKTRSRYCPSIRRRVQSLNGSS